MTSEPREPWWAWNEFLMAKARNQLRGKECADGCGFMIYFLEAPRGPEGRRGGLVPFTLIGEKPNPSDTTKTIGRLVIHHDICTNPRIPGNRDPQRSHRIAVNEDEPEVPDEQQQFRLRRQETFASEG